MTSIPDYQRLIHTKVTEENGHHERKKKKLEKKSSSKVGIYVPCTNLIALIN